MKKVLFLFAFLLLGIGAMAQKVIYDETNQTGVRTVVCEGMNLGVSNNMDVYVALAGFQYKSTIRYSLAVTIGSGHEVEIPNDSKCVLTLDNGKALELPTVAGGASRNTAEGHKAFQVVLADGEQIGYSDGGYNDNT